MMTKTEMLDTLRRYLPPPVLAEFIKAWWVQGLEDEARANALQEPHEANTQALANGQENEDAEPWLRDCPFCPPGTSHDIRLMDACPNNPYRKVNHH